MPRRTSRIVVGIMSGTSADGIDAVACEITGRGAGMRPAILAHYQCTYEHATRTAILNLAAGMPATAHAIAALHAELGRAYAMAAHAVLKRAAIPIGRLSLVGCHGQTIHHAPPRIRRRARTANRNRVAARRRVAPIWAESNGSTWQLGDRSILAESLQVPVVGAFRDADMAAGGQGAPLVPWTDYVLFGRARRPRAIQNIGGIANVTWLPGGSADSVVAFDCGPGNMLIDDMMRHFTRGIKQFDAGGAWAAAGTVVPQLLRRWQRHPYFDAPPPKSCGREEFGRHFWQASLRRISTTPSPQGVVATATRLTAWSIAQSYRRFLQSESGSTITGDLIVCGGGACNQTLLTMLRDELPSMRILTIDQLGIPNQAKEALSFAMLACACIDGIPANLPQVTGASRKVICGSVTMP